MTDYQGIAAIISAVGVVLSLALTAAVIYYGFTHNAKLDDIARLVRAIHARGDDTQEYDVR